MKTDRELARKSFFGKPWPFVDSSDVNINIGGVVFIEDKY